MRSAYRWLLCIALLLGLASPALGAGGYGLWKWYLIPAAGSLPGANGTYWRLDLAVLNPYSWRSITVRIAFLQEKTDNTTAPYRDFTINPGGQLNLADVVGTQFGVTGKGALELWTQDGSYFTTNARSYTASPGGTYGQGISGQDYTVGDNGQAFTPGIRVDANFRTNIGAVSVSSVPISVLARVFDMNGAFQGSYTFNLLPFSNEQVAVSSFAPAFGPGSVQWSCLTTGDSIEWVAYATPIDNTSGDGIYLEERVDDQYTTAQPAWNLSGVWVGTLSIVGVGSEQVTLEITQDLATVTGDVYDTSTGFHVMYLSGYEDQGTISFNGYPYVLQYKDDSLWGTATVMSSTSMAGTFSGTDYYSGGGSFELSYSYSLAPKTEASRPTVRRGHRAVGALREKGR
jgi:hypothetical protein